MSKQMTPEEYVEHTGNNCPSCRAENSVILEGHLETDGASAWSNCSCDVCGAIWTEEYKLVSYNNLEPGEK